MDGGTQAAEAQPADGGLKAGLLLKSGNFLGQEAGVGAGARLSLSEPPALLSRLELVLTGAHADDSSQLSALKKSIELLHVASKAVVVADHYHPVRLFCRSQYSLHSTGGER